MNKRQTVIERVGVLSALGKNFTEVLEALRSGPKAIERPTMSLHDVPVEKLLNDRKLSRAISLEDTVGLLALDQCQVEHEDTTNPHRIGMFVGAQCPPASDNGIYARAMVEANFSEKEFGKTYIVSHPMALLKNLANNVLCYGAIRLNAKGVNSNYTNLDTAGHVSLIQAMRAIQYDKADVAYAGAYRSITKDEPSIAMFERQSYLSTDPICDFKPLNPSSRSTLLSDGAVFIRLAVATQDSNQVELVDGDIAQDLSGPHCLEGDPTPLIEMVVAMLERNGLELHDVGSIFLAGNGHPKSDSVENFFVSSLWPDVEARPRQFCLAPFTGNGLEVSGVLDVAVAGEVLRDPLLRRRLSLDESDRAPRTPVTLIVRSGLWGDYSCLLVRGGEIL